MIQRYRLSLSKRNLQLFEENSEFLIYFDIHGNKNYYATEVRWKKLPTNFYELCDTLESLWMISGVFESDERFTPHSIIVEWLYQEKLKLLRRILHSEEKIKNKALLSRIFQKLEKDSIDIDSLIKKLRLNDRSVYFEDAEIFIHAINILYPHKIPELEKILFKQNLNTELEEQRKSVKYVIVKNTWIYNDKNEIIFDFTAYESKIVNELKSKWMNLETLKVITKQPTINAVSSTIKEIQKKIKKYKLEAYLKLYYSRSEKVYYLKILKH